MARRLTAGERLARARAREAEADRRRIARLAQAAATPPRRRTRAQKATITRDTKALARRTAQLRASQPERARQLRAQLAAETRQRRQRRRIRVTITGKPLLLNNIGSPRRVTRRVHAILDPADVGPLTDANIERAAIAQWAQGLPFIAEPGGELHIEFEE